MVVFDDMFGLVDRGTPGVRGGAVVENISDEIACLDRLGERCFQTAPLGDEDESVEQSIRDLRRSDISDAADQLSYARQDRSDAWGLMRDHMYDMSLESRHELTDRLKWQRLSNVRADVLFPLECRLSAHAPCWKVIEDGANKRAARGFGDDE